MNNNYLWDILKLNKDKRIFIFMSIKIITDSISDIPFTDQKKLNIEILPLCVSIDGQEYLDGIEITREEFYERLPRCQKLPTTSQVSPDKFEAAFNRINRKQDEALVILSAHTISGTFQSACIARDAVGGENIFIIDSENVCVGEALLVYEAIRLRNEGRTCAEIIEHINSIKGRVRLIAFIDTIKYLKMGGRISATSAMFASVLNIKPIVTMQQGEIKLIDKARGQNAAFDCLLKLVLKSPPKKDSLFVVGDSNNKDLSNTLSKMLKKAIKSIKIEQLTVGPVVGTHAGPNCAGLAFIAR